MSLGNSHRHPPLTGEIQQKVLRIFGGRAPHVCPAVPVVKMTVDDLIVEISVLFGRHRDIADDQVLGEREFKVANRAGLPCKVVGALLQVWTLGKCPS